MKFLLACLACALILTPGLARASTYHEKYVEYLYYDFTYYFPHFPIAIDTGYGAYDRAASVGTDPGGYGCLDLEPDDEGGCWPYPIQFGFHLEGSEILPLDNLTFDFKALPVTLGGRAVGGFYNSFEWLGGGGYEDDGYYCEFDYDGSISFGPSGEIASYNMGYGGECGSAEAARASSTPRHLSGDGIVHGDLLEGLSIYDSIYWEPDEEYFSLRPGYWTTSITRLCGYEISEDDQVYDFRSVPCPAAPPPPPAFASAPLPAAGWLLLGALGLLGAGAARGRRG